MRFRREERFVGADPVGHGHEAGEQPERWIIAAIWVFGGAMGWRQTEHRKEFCRDPISMRGRPFDEGFAWWLERAAFGSAVMRADGDGPTVSTGFPQ
ncbi:MAG TPA: hypothetical protein PK322_11095 [Opitutaceae bacterium]|nr:hypothetical protein [Opitutaceae bacterium]